MKDTLRKVAYVLPLTILACVAMVVMISLVIGYYIGWFYVGQQACLIDNLVLRTIALSAMVVAAVAPWVFIGVMGSTKIVDKTVAA